VCELLRTGRVGQGSYEGSLGVETVGYKSVDASRSRTKRQSIG
jgi:hypothetical protein